MPLVADLITAVTDVVVEVLALLWQMLGFKRGLAVGFLAVALCVAVFAGVLMYGRSVINTRVANANLTTQLIEQQIEELTRNLDQNGGLIRSAELLPVNDAWGSPLRVEFETTAFHEVVTVLSKGPDRVAQTRDDLSESRRVSKPKAQIAREGFEKAKQQVREKLSIGE